MRSLSSYNARICLTAVAFCFHKSKVLLVKHKKLKIWLAPGGHVDDGELPHQAAQRECWEETGIKVKAVSNTQVASTYSQFVPNPLYSNLHWISRDNFDTRRKSADPSQPNTSTLWPRGCEQHLVLAYLVKPVGSTKLKQNIEETDGIGWFTLSESQKLDTTPDIKAELQYAFSLL